MRFGPTDIVAEAATPSREIRSTPVPIIESEVFIGYFGFRETIREVNLIGIVLLNQMSCLVCRGASCTIAIVRLDVVVIAANW